MKTYYICTISRTGSSWLCELLSSTGVLGLPGEHLNSIRVADNCRAWGLPEGMTRAYVNRLLAERSAGGVFGCKGVLIQLKQLARHTKINHYVYLRRHDLLRQAISMYRANVTGRWQTQPPLPAVPFDRAAIRECLRKITAANARWQAWLTATSARYLPLWYEELQADPDWCVRRIADHIGVDLPEKMELRSSFEVLRDELTEEFVRRWSNL